MAFEIALGHLERKGMSERVQTFAVSTATVELAAQAVGVEPARIAKTLSFELDAESCVLIVCAGDARIDNKKFKTIFHTKARMLLHDRAEELTGHKIGGVCPFGVPQGTRICLDVSLQRFETVFPACGSDNSAVCLSPQELQDVTGGEWIDVCNWQSKGGTNDAK